MMRKMRYIAICGILVIGALSLYGCGFEDDVNALMSEGTTDVAVPTAEIATQPPVRIERATNSAGTSDVVATRSAGEDGQIAQFGDVRDIGPLKVIVVGWSYLKPEDSHDLRPDQTVVVVDLVEVNAGSKIVSTLSKTDMSLKDSEGRQYSSKATSLLPVHWRLPGGRIVPGEKIRGSIGFEISHSAKDLVFDYQPSDDYVSAFAIMFGGQPMSAALPSVVPGEVVPTAHIGDIVTQADVSLTVNSFADLITDQIFTPDPRNRLVAVDITIENTSKKPITVSPFMQMNVRDVDGATYSFSLMSMEGMEVFPDGEIVPGAKVRGKVPFEVPVNSKDLVFVFDDDFINPHRFFVLLSKGT